MANRASQMYVARCVSVSRTHSALRTDPLWMEQPALVCRRTGGKAPLCAFLSTLEVNWKRRLSSSSLN